MKKQLFFLMLITGCILAFTGCKKDDDDEKVGSLIGRWDLISENYKYYVNGKVEDEESDTYTVGEKYLVLTATEYSGTVGNGTYVLSGNTLTITDNEHTTSATITWKNKNEFVLTDRDDDGPNEYEITESTYVRH